jgi:hypothetical protein
VSRRGSHQTRRGSRKPSGFTTTGSISGHNSSIGVKWKVVGEDVDVASLTAEQMINSGPRNGYE